MRNHENQTLKTSNNTFLQYIPDRQRLTTFIIFDDTTVASASCAQCARLCVSPRKRHRPEILSETGIGHTLMLSEACNFYAGRFLARRGWPAMTSENALSASVLSETGASTLMRRLRPGRAWATHIIRSSHM